MKTFFKFLLLTVILPVCFACSEKEEVSYSCDKAIDQWVKANLATIQTMTRADWAETPVKYHRAIYAAFSPSQKHHFWIGKLEETLRLDWGPDEREHLEKLIEFICDNGRAFYPEAMEDDAFFESFERFTYLWIEHCEKKLGWDRYFIGQIIASGETLGENTPKTRSTDIDIIKDSEIPLGTECKCSIESDWCFLSKCTNACEFGGKNCGSWWVKQCDGVCQ